jgi:hypothetical protein
LLRRALDERAQILVSVVPLGCCLLLDRFEQGCGGGDVWLAREKRGVSVFYRLPTKGYTRGGKFRLGDAEIRNLKVQGTQGLDRFGP